MTMENKEINAKDEALKLSNGKYANDEETKKAYEEYMLEVQKYNEQVEKGEQPDVKMDEILNKYHDLFYDKSLEEGLKKIQEDFKNKEKDTTIDELIANIDSKLENLNNEEMCCPVCGEKLMFMMQAPTLYCKKCHKYFENDNGKVGNETDYPYTESEADY